MKTLHQDGSFAFFASTIEDGDFAVPLRTPDENQTDFYRRIGWTYFLTTPGLRGILVKGLPPIELPSKGADNTPERRSREIGTVHVAQLVHGDRIATVGPILHNPEDGLYERNVHGGPAYHAGTDGFITDEPMCALVVTGADCPPVLVMDPIAKAIALVHSGRKGTALNIAGKAVAALSAKTGTPPSAFRAIIGPGIACHHYEVGQDIADEFKALGWQKALWGAQIGGTWKWLLDLKYVIAHQLTASGLAVPTDDLRLGSEDTFDHPERWHSFRRDTKLGRKLERPRVQAFCAALLT